MSRTHPNSDCAELPHQQFSADSVSDLSDNRATLGDLLRELRRIRAHQEKPARELLSAEEAAELCGVSRPTWDRMRSARLVPAPVTMNHGNIIRWRRALLLAWIADGCPRPEEE